MNDSDVMGILKWSILALRGKQICTLLWKLLNMSATVSAIGELDIIIICAMGLITSGCEIVKGCWT